MALPLQLSNIKSSGMYRFVIDKSEIPGEESQIMRLLVGYSEIGPFNIPVYIEDEEQFKSIFGDINKRLERYGVFFHRLALEALEAGPLYCLNLKTFTTEKVGTYSFNPTSTSLTQLNLGVETLYDTNRFWILRPEHLVDDDVTNALGITSSNYITLTHTDTNNLDSTVIIRRVPASELTQYHSTVSEWFNGTLNGETIPDYLLGHENDYLDQYFMEIYVFRGNLYSNLTTDEHTRYFETAGTPPNEIHYIRDTVQNAFGDDIDALQSVSELQDSNFVNAYRGILFPNFYDAFGGPLSLDTIFNNDYDAHHMMMYFDPNYLDANITSPTDLNNVISTSNSALTIDTRFTTEEATGNGQLSMAIAPMQHTYPSGVGVTHDSIFNTTDNIATLSVNSTYRCKQYNEMQYDLPIIATIDGYELSYTDAKCMYDVYVTSGSSFPDEDAVHAPETPPESGDFLALVNCGHYDITSDSGIRSGANIFGGGAAGSFTVTLYARYLSVWSEDAHDFVWKSEPEDTFYMITNNTNGADANDFSLYGAVRSPECGYSVNLGFDTKVSADGTRGNRLYLPEELNGYKKEHTKPEGGINDCSKRAWIDNHLLKALVRYRGLRNALTNNVDIEYRYLLDGFDTPICTTQISERNPDPMKSVLAQICRLKDNVFGILNFPRIQCFNKDQYKVMSPGSTIGTIDFTKVTNVLAMPKQNEGASWVGYYTQFIYQDPFTGVKTTVPSAAIVSNEFLQKYIDRHEFSIVAGTNFGVVETEGMVGPDYNFSREDRDVLEPFGTNVLLFDPKKGTYINSNQTAQQRPKTTLSSINVRELCIHIQNGIERILLDNHWEFNTPELRDRVKQSADALMERVFRNGGVYIFRNICDESNNTDAVIDNEMFVIDTEIEPTRGAGKMVQRLTLYRKGGLSSQIM